MFYGVRAAGIRLISSPMAMFPSIVSVASPYALAVNYDNGFRQFFHRDCH